MRLLGISSAQSEFLVKHGLPDLAMLYKNTKDTNLLSGARTL